MSTLIGIHPVREALKAGRSLDRVVFVKGASGRRLQEILELCRHNGVPIRYEPRDVLDRAAGGGAHQGVMAFGAPTTYASLEDLPAGALLVVVLDGVEDPHNLGAIIRSANAAGANAVIIPERRAVHVTDTVAKSAAGALEYVPIIKVGNLARALEQLKERGFWIYGLDERATTLHDATEYSTPTALVLGGEGKGLHQLVREHCDVLVRIGMAGQIPSLNVSVAAGVVMFEWRRTVKERSTR